MTDVTIYDSRGYPLGDDDATRDEAIQKIGRYGVMFSLEFGTPIELIIYFRGYESQSGRMEQYYARVVADSQSALSDTHDAIVSAAERRHDLEIEESASGENVFSSLRDTTGEQVGSREQRNRIQYLLSRGQRLRFGAPSYEAGIRLITQLRDAKPGLRAAITEGDSTLSESLSKYDLVIEKGPYAALEPLGDTADLMDPSPDEPDSSGLLGKYSTVSVGGRTLQVQLLLEALSFGTAVVVGLVVLYVVVVLVAIYVGASGLIPGSEALKAIIGI